MAGLLGTIRARAGESLTDNERSLLAQWAEARSRLATLAFRLVPNSAAGDPAEGDSSAAQVEEARAEAERIEAKLSAVRERVGLQADSIGIDLIQKAIPDDGRLVEFFLYQPYDINQRRLGPSRYVAYVLGRTGEPAWAELAASADEVDQAVINFRDALRDPGIAISDVKRRAQGLYDLVMRPVIERAGVSNGRLLISPDGQLNLLPFGALVNETGQFLVERFSLTYLTSGRDLLRLQSVAPGGGGSVIVANPQFRLSAADSGATSLTESPASAAWRPLQGTEADAQRLLPSAHLLYGPQATEAAVKRLEAPEILHIVTHGVFISAPLSSARQRPGGRGGNLDTLFSGVPQESTMDEPMLRSGLVLAASPAPSEQNDGILRALELAALNLFGTKLVVLSACDTGRGEVRAGEGVYGLRRALVMAGAESQIVSLWKVDEVVANRLFRQYYGLLMDGKGRGDAWRDVQLAALRDPTLRHPYYWAAFVQGGAWSPLDGASMSRLRHAGEQ
jgi:CHAT domain-containing protein